MNQISLGITRLIRAPRERVFAAWTTPELLTKWWGPGPVTCPEAAVDLRQGGEYRIANLEQDGSITWITGRFERVTPPAQLVYTWNVSIIPGPATLVTVEFRDHPSGTELVLKHDRFSDPAVSDMHGQGWNACIDKLETLLAGG